MHTSDTELPEHGHAIDDDGIGLLDLLTVLAERWRLLVGGPLLVGVLALGASFLITPTFTAKTTFLPPQQPQSSAASALASLGALAGLAGGSAGIKTPGDQYVALMQTVNVEDRIVDQFKLMTAYKAKFRFEARRELENNVRIALGKKDGLINVEADADSPETAAAIANQYVAELRRLSSELALTEAQQRRVFFEAEVKRTKEQLATAQAALQSSGFNASALKAEPKAAADTYARLKAEATSAEVRLQTLRRSLTDTSPEVEQQSALLSALRVQLERLEQNRGDESNGDYIGRYREFKYQEALFDLFSKQYEAARMDESRDGGLLQVVDVATPPEHKSKPKRALIAVGATAGAVIFFSFYLFCSLIWQRTKADPGNAERLDRLRRAWSYR